jgi:hypothetical protein
MNKSIKRVVGIAATAAVGFGIMAVTAPSASAAGRGSASVSEINKLSREMDRQKCVTLKEVRKIIHGNGTREWTRPGSWKGYTWNGSGDVDYLDVRFHKNCVYYTEWSSTDW